MGNYILQPASSREEAMLSAILRVKRVRWILDNGQQGERDSRFYDNKDCVYGLDTLIEYLDERFPEPKLMPDTPLNRAVIRSCAKTFYSAKNLEAVLETYKPYYSQNVYISSNRMPNLVDVLVYATTPKTPEWRTLKTAFDTQFPCTQINETNPITERDDLDLNIY